MSWPLSQDYNEAIQDPRNSFSDGELKTGEVVTNALGIPMPRSGNFADVYEVRCPSGSRWAVKCFTREVPGLRDRYAEISKYLHQANLPFMVDFQYLEQGIRVRGQWYPILKMQWVEGFVLNEFVRDNLDKKPILQALGQIWLRMAKRLRESKLAHGDLQHGNVMFVPGSSANSLAVKLIDYDGMCVPALAGKKSGEVGHPAYQHPERLRTGAYSQEIDRFSLLSIGTALRCLSIGGRSLWERYDNGDNLLFRQADLQAPAESPLFQELLAIGDPQTQTLVKALERACRGPLAAVPLLTDLLPEEKPAGKTTKRVAVSSSVSQQRADAQGPDWDFGAEEPGASFVKKRQASRGMPLWAWGAMGGAAAVVLLSVGIGLGLFFFKGPAEKKETPVARNKPETKTSEPAVKKPPEDSPAGQVPRATETPDAPPPVDNSKDESPPPRNKPETKTSEPAAKKPPEDGPAGQAPRVTVTPNTPPSVNNSKGESPFPIDQPGNHPLPIADVPKGALPLFQDDFHNPKARLRWAVSKQEKLETGYAEGKYYIRRMGFGWSFLPAPFRSPADFVCEVEGRSVGPERDSWGLYIYSRVGDKLDGIQVLVQASGQVRAMPLVHLPGRNEPGPVRGPIEHAGIKRGAEWNTLRVIVQGRRIAVDVNGARVLEPFELDRAISPGEFALTSSGPRDEGLAEFRRFTVFPLKPPSAAQPSGANGWDRPLDPDGDCTFQEADGKLTLTVPGKDHDLGAERGQMNAPCLLRDVEGDFTAQVHVSGDFQPSTDSTVNGKVPVVGAGLLLKVDEKNYVRLERFVLNREQQLSSYGNWEMRQNGQVTFAEPSPRLLGKEAFVRLERRGDKLFGSISEDGQKWIGLKPIDLTLPRKIKIGVAAISTSSRPFTPTFDQFQLKQGQGKWASIDKWLAPMGTVSTPKFAWEPPVDPDGDCKFKETEGKLTIMVPAKPHALHLDGRDMNSPRLVSDVEGDFTVQVRVNGDFRHAPRQASGEIYNFIGAGLLVWVDRNTFLRLERAGLYQHIPPLYVNWEAREDAKTRETNHGFQRLNAAATYLRLERRGKQMLASYSEDGQNWRDMQPLEMELPAKIKIGVLACSTTSRPFAPIFDQFQIQKGQGEMVRVDWPSLPAEGGVVVKPSPKPPVPSVPRRQRQPVPEAAAVEAAVKDIRASHKEDYTSGKPNQLHAVLFKEANAARGDPVRHFAILQELRDLLAEANVRGGLS